MKKKIILLIIIILVALGCVCYFVLSNDKKSEENVVSNENVQSMNDTVVSPGIEVADNEIEINLDDNVQNDSNIDFSVSVDLGYEDWHTARVLNENGVEVEFAEVFGSSYASFGSYLRLYEDGTFVDAIIPVTSAEVSTEGNYRVIENYNTLGDYYIELTYSNDDILMVQRVTLDDSGKDYLVVTREGNFYYQYYLTQE